MKGDVMRALAWTRIAGLLPPHDPGAGHVQVVVRGFSGEDALYGTIRQCAADTERVMTVTGRWEVVVRRRPSHSHPDRVYEVWVRLATRRATYQVTHQDPHAYVAVRGAFARIREAKAKDARPSPESALGCPWRACSPT